MHRLKRNPERLLILAQRAREFAKGYVGPLADLYHEHAAICESKAAAQKSRRRKAKRTEKCQSGI